MRARVVLVLDAGLMTLNLRNWNVQAFAYMFTCGWAQRSWCLQEDVLAGWIAFQFKSAILIMERGLPGDMPIHIEQTNPILRLPRHWIRTIRDAVRWLRQTDLMQLDCWYYATVSNSVYWIDQEDAQSSGTRAYSRSWRRQHLGRRSPLRSGFTLDSLWLRLRHVDPEKEHDALIFETAYNALAYRSTSKTDDLIFLFATILNLDTRPFLEVSDADRMAMIYTTFVALPFELFLVNDAKPGCKLSAKEIQSAVDSSVEWTNDNKRPRCQSWLNLINGLPDLIQGEILSRDSFIYRPKHDPSSYHFRILPTEYHIVRIEQSLNEHRQLIHLGGQSFELDRCFPVQKNQQLQASPTLPIFLILRKDDPLPDVMPGVRFTQTDEGPDKMGAHEVVWTCRVHLKQTSETFGRPSLSLVEKSDFSKFYLKHGKDMNMHQAGKG